MQARAESPPAEEESQVDEPQVEAVPVARPRAYSPPQGYAPQGYPPPVYAPPTYPPQSYGPPPLLAYDDSKKYPALGLLLELLVPGLGSVYADHPTGAATTWGLMLGGAAMLVVGINQQQTYGDVRQTSNAGISMAVTGVVMVICGRAYGLIDSWASSSDYNSALATRLGLAQGSLIVAPIPTGGGRMAWGPGLSLRF
jgi:hypothetical protein